MWFECVLIDSIDADGSLRSFHIRALNRESVVVDRLEDIDPQFHRSDAEDFGPLRVYSMGQMKTSVIEAKLKNVACDGTDLYIQLDHFGIPVWTGYYACLLPTDWRVTELHVYDPYSNKENPAENKGYRGVLKHWDAQARRSCIQFEMISNRGTFSIGLIARLRRADSGSDFLEEPGTLAVQFTDTRRNPAQEAAYSKSAEVVISETQNTAPQPAKMPPVNISLTGPSIDLVAWGKYIANKIRRPRGGK